MRNRLTLYLAGLASISVLFLLGLRSCWIASSSTVPAETLLIDVSVLPRGWSVSSLPYSARGQPHILLDQRAKDFAYIGFASPSTKLDYQLYAHHTIWNFGSDYYASRMFQQKLSSPSPESIYELQNWAYQSEAADRFQLRCETVKSLPGSGAPVDWVTCRAVGQYDQYLSVFNTPLGLEYDMSPVDLANILRAIDIRMVQQFGTKDYD